MQIILKKDVENLGFKDDLVSVKNGYGRNFLIPQGMAVLATPSARKVLEENLRQQAFKEKKQIEEAQKIAKAIKALEVKILAKTGGSDKLFGSVSNNNVSETLSKLGHTVDKKFIKVQGGTIKQTGKYNATIRLHREVIVDIPFEVVPEAKK